MGPEPGIAVLIRMCPSVVLTEDTQPFGAPMPHEEPPNDNQHPQSDDDE
jgi:hypothetical protein